MASIPKAVLYYSPVSIWSAAVLLVLEEKGYAQDEIGLKQVNINKGDNFDPTFLRLNPKATVPVLVVPLQKTLAGDVESRYKAIIETEDIIAFLDKSRSATSRTHTTSNAPAPSLAPATVASSILCKNIINALHEDKGDPIHLRNFNARDDISLQTLAGDLLPDLIHRQRTLTQYILEAEQDKIHVSMKTVNFWREKKEGLEILVKVLEQAHKPRAELDEIAEAARAEYYKQACCAWEVDLIDLLIRVDSQITGPLCLGDQLSTADLHLASWMAGIVKLAGGTYEDDGSTAIGKLENHIGNGFALAKDFRKDGETECQSKLGVFWDTLRERGSWKKLYNL